MTPVADPTAVMGRRIGASVIDGALVIVPATLVLADGFTEADAALRAREGWRVQDAEEFCEAYLEQEDTGFCLHLDDTVYYSDTGFLTAGLVLYGLAIAFHVVLQGLTGWTIGKRLTGIRVVQADGRKAAFWRVLVRWLLWVVDGLPVAGLVGFITGLTSTGHRRVGDMVAKTFVVRATAMGSPIVVPGLAAPSHTGPVPPTGAPPAGTGPQWDEARGTYIQWDPDAGTWMQWDEGARRWDPIPGQAAPVTPPPPPPPPASPPPPPG